MSKKKKFVIRRPRKRSKKTTGQLVFKNVITMETEKTPTEYPSGYIKGNAEKDRLYATCTCGKWRSSPEAKTITQVAKEAAEHAKTSENCMLRQHSTDPDAPLFGDVMTEEEADALGLRAENTH